MDWGFNGAEGAAAVALHARTAADYYSGNADWDAIARLKDAVRSIPVLGNGDIWSAEDAVAMVEALDRGADLCMGSRFAGEIKPGALVDGPIMFEADLGYEIDNFEGLDVHQTADGETVLTLISDDNFSLIQRNLLLQFTLVE